MTPEAKAHLDEKRRNPDLFEGEGEYYYTMASLRDLFAGFAMAGLLSNPSIDELGPAEIAHDAGAYADAMLKERAK